MKQSIKQFFKAVSLGLVLSITVLPVSAQDNQSSTGEMKKSGSETKKAGKSLGQNLKHGRVARGGKYFGKHMGRAGKHVGRGTKKAFKKIFS